MRQEIVGRAKTVAKSLANIQFDALDLLRSDHMKAEAALIHLKMMGDPAKITKQFKQIRKDLDLHMWIEEEYFYPACEKIRELSGEIEHSRRDHQLVKDVLVDLKEMDPGTRGFDNLVNKLIIEIEKHVSEEEDHVFPIVRQMMDKRQLRRLSEEMIKAHNSGGRVRSQVQARVQKSSQSRVHGRVH